MYGHQGHLGKQSVTILTNFRCQGPRIVHKCIKPVAALTLTLTALWASSANNILMIFSYFFPKKISSDISYKLSPQKIIHAKCQILFFSSEKYLKMSSAEIVTQHAVLSLVLLNPDISCLCKQCRSRSVGF